MLNNKLLLFFTMSENLKGSTVWHTNALLQPSKDNNISSSEYPSTSRQKRGLFDTIQGSQSSPNGRITRVQSNPYLARPRGPPRVGLPNNQMLQAGSRNALRNVIKNDVFIKHTFTKIFDILAFFCSFSYKKQD